MNNLEGKIQSLVKLKSYEQPSDGYFEEFLEEFQSRQRQELLRKSSVSLLMERAGTWFRELGSIKWFAGAGVAYASVMFGVFLFLPASGPQENPNVQPASWDKSEPIFEVDFENGRNFRSGQDTRQEF